MQFLRRAAVGLAASPLVLVLFSFGFGWSAWQVFGSAREIKQALDQSGIYKTVVGEVLKQHQQDSTGTSNDKVPVNQPEIRRIIGQAFPPDFLQAQAETVLDATYHWLDGTTPALQFSIDLSSAKTRLADGIGQYAQTRLASLPVCTADNLPTGDVDAFNTTCVPPGFDSNAAANQARDQILNGDFLKDAKLDASTVKPKDGKTISQQLHAAPEAYQRVRTGLLLGGILALGLATAIIFLAASWRAGVRKVAIILLSVGGMSVGLGLLSSFAMHQVAHKIASSHAANTALQTQLIDIVQRLTDALRTHWLVYGVTLIVVGVATLLALHFTRPHESPDTHVGPEATEKGKSNKETDAGEPGAAEHTGPHKKTPA